MFKQACLQFACAVSAATALAAPADKLPDLNEARVTIPYSELKALWQAAQRETAPPAKPKAPLEAMLLSARYQLALKADQASGVAEYEAQSFSDDWTVIPLLGAQAQVESIEPESAQVVVRDGSYALITNHAGKQKVKIQFGAKLAATGAGAKLLVPISPAAITTLALSGIPQKQTLTVAGATQISAENDRASFRLAAQPGIEIELAPQKAIAPPTPSRWKIEPQAFVEVSEGALDYETHLIAEADNGSGLSMDLKFPATARVLKITGADLTDWQLTTAEDHTHLAHLRWQTRDLLRREIEIHYSLPQALTAAEWKLAAPHIVDGESQPPLYAIVPKEGLELTTPDATSVPRTLPRWLSERLAGKTFVGVTGDAPLQAKWLPLVQTPLAVVESAQAAMRIVGDGPVLNELTYVLHYDAGMPWRLDLPEGSELLACSVDGKRVNPVNRGEHAIDVPLPPGKNNAQVKLSLMARKPAFKPVSGQIVVELPATELLVQRTDWGIRIPLAYEAEVQGNAERTGTKTDADGRVIHLRKEFCKGERPSAELFYQKPQTETK